MMAGHTELMAWAGDISSFLAALGVIYLLLAAYLVYRFPREPRRKAVVHPPASMLAPLCGEDGGLRERLAALCRQDYDAPFEVVCGVQDQNDPAVGIVNSVAAEMGGGLVKLKVDPKQSGANRKISNLLNMAPSARNPLMVIIDSDILVGPDHLSKVVDALERPNVGAVTCLYHGMSGVGLWSNLSALSINVHFLPSVIMALTFGIARPCFGSTIALSRGTLEGIGGLWAFKDCLHDDYAIGERLRDAGHDVAIPHFSVGHVCREGSALALMQNQLRAARTIRMIKPLEYAASIIAHPMAFAIPAAALGAAHGFTLLLFALGARLALCLAVESRFSLNRQTYWLLPFCDLLFLLVYTASFFGGRIVWRGARYRLRSDGTLVPESR